MSGSTVPPIHPIDFTSSCQLVRCALLSLAVALSFAIPSTAQIPNPIPGTGDAAPIALFGNTNGTVRVGTTLTVTGTWTGTSGTGLSVLAFGNRVVPLLDWSSMLGFCAAGPANWMLDQGTFLYVAAVGDTVTLNLPIPNNRNLPNVLRYISVQGLHADIGAGCWAMSLGYQIALRA